MRRDGSLFFTTSQVVESDLKGSVLDYKESVCLVINEAHRAIWSFAYSNVVQVIYKFKSSYGILVLIAIPGVTLENAQEVVNNLNIFKIEIKTEQSSDIIPYMKYKEIKKYQYNLFIILKISLNSLTLLLHQLWNKL